jgi:hypothetical protein
MPSQEPGNKPRYPGNKFTRAYAYCRIKNLSHFALTGRASVVILMGSGRPLNNHRAADLANSNAGESVLVMGK